MGHMDFGAGSEGTFNGAGKRNTHTQEVDAHDGAKLNFKLINLNTGMIEDAQFNTAYLIWSPKCLKLYNT